MSKRIWLAVGVLGAFLSGVCLLGNAGDAGCEMPKPKTPQELCAESGGTWGTPANWPTPCGKNPATVKGPATAAGESACICPGIKPNWRDGVGCDKCDIGQCIGSAWPCESYYGFFDRCLRHLGCYYWSDSDECKGFPLQCNGRDSQSLCQQIDGCVWYGQ